LDAVALLGEMLTAAGWTVQDDATTISREPTVLRNFPFPAGEIAYALVLDRQLAGVVVVTTTEDEDEISQLTRRYSQATQSAPSQQASSITTTRSPLPYTYICQVINDQSLRLYFTNWLEPEPVSRQVFHFHRPTTLNEWLAQAPAGVSAADTNLLRARLRRLPRLEETGLYPCQFEAIRGLEASLAAHKPRALIQMATGSGKTCTAINSVYRLIKFAGARRVLFLVDRAHLGRQALQEFQSFRTPDDNRIFTDVYTIQLLQNNHIEPAAQVCITTIQRLYSILRGESEMAGQRDEESLFEAEEEQQQEQVSGIEYNPSVPIETFDFIIVDECHRSIYGSWAPVLTYFDAFITGLTATPGRRAKNFFNNQVMTYSYEQAVLDGVNVDYRIYRLRTKITESGNTIECDNYVPVRNTLTRAERQLLLEQDFSYDADEVNRSVVAPDQIRQIIRAYRDHYHEWFPGRTLVPKTLIFAQNDTHANDIVEIVRNEFNEGADFVKKITYKSVAGGERPENLLSDFRTDYNPRIAVTVDMIATGTDVKPLEVLLFMRQVKSPIFFEQMKGRGARTIDPAELQTVTRDARTKDYFVLVDAVRVSETMMIENQPLNRKPSQPLSALLEQAEQGPPWSDDLLSTLAYRLRLLLNRISKEDKERLEQTTQGQSIETIRDNLVHAVDRDEQVARAQEKTRPNQPDEAAIRAARDELVQRAMSPFTDPTMRTTLLEVYKHEQIIDVSEDIITEQGWDQREQEQAEEKIVRFSSFLSQNGDKIEQFLNIYNSQPPRSTSRGNNKFDALRQLENEISASMSLNLAALWDAYSLLDGERISGTSVDVERADLVTIIRYTQERESNPAARLEHYRDCIMRNYERWYIEQQSAGQQPFTEKQEWWLGAMRDHISMSLALTPGEFRNTPFSRAGGYGRATQDFDGRLPDILRQLNERLIE
jgi:type I restriction enzyme, R subunit